MARRVGALVLRPRSVLALQVAVALLLVVGLVAFLDWRSLVASISGLKASKVLGSAGLVIFAVLVGAFDLWVLLGGLTRISYLRVLRV
ncbi:MAG: hypothetical protein ACLF0P_09265, partial [Thermoanaerobaculia bacterium]